MVCGAVVDGVVPQSGTWSRDWSGGWIGWQGDSGTWWVAKLQSVDSCAAGKNPEFMDDQLVVLQDVRRPFPVVESYPHCG